MILIGVEIEDPSSLALEWNTLQMDNQQALQLFPSEKIGYRIRKILEFIQKIRSSSYSLSAKLQF